MTASILLIAQLFGWVWFGSADDGMIDVWVCEDYMIEQVRYQCVRRDFGKSIIECPNPIRVRAPMNNVALPSCTESLLKKELD